MWPHVTRVTYIVTTCDSSDVSMWPCHVAVLWAHSFLNPQSQTSMKRLRWKQTWPPPPAPPDLPFDGGGSAASVVDTESAGIDEEAHKDVAASSRWSLLNSKTIGALVSGVVRDTEDAELHTLTIQPLLEKVVSRAAGKISMEEALSCEGRLYRWSHVGHPEGIVEKAGGSSEKRISSRVQSCWRLAVRNWQPDEAKELPHHVLRPPTRGCARQATDARSCACGIYCGEVSCRAVFLEKHSGTSEKVHYHVATQLSGCVRWVAWKSAPVARGHSCHFSNMVVCNHSHHRRMQYPFMLRYLYLPTERKPLSSLDRSPVLWCNAGRHPPLMDAINGQIDSIAFQERLEEVFLQRHARKRGRPSKFSDLELWPVVKAIKVEADDPILLPKLLKYGRDSGNDRLLAFLFRHTAESVNEKVRMCWTLENCEKIIENAATTTWRKLTAALDMPCRCMRQWAHATREILQANGISESELCQHIRRALMLGLQKKQDTLCFAGSGNEGKSFILKPLTLIYQHVTWCHRGVFFYCFGIMFRPFPRV